MDTAYLNAFYEGYDEEQRFARRSSRVEFLTTVRYIDRYLRPGMRILEVGAGTGRYSRHYAAQGYSVDAVELVEHNIAVLRKHRTPDMDLRVRQGNACDLSAYADDRFDCTLLLGPLYHLFSPEDKRRAVAEALRVTKPGGLLYAAFIMNDATILSWGLQQGHLAEGLKNGLITQDFHCASVPEMVFEMSTLEEIESLMAGFPVKTRHLVASNGMSCHFADCLDGADDELFDAWLAYHFHTCERRELLGYSSHLLFVGEKVGKTE